MSKPIPIWIAAICVSAVLGLRAEQRAAGPGAQAVTGVAPGSVPTLSLKEALDLAERNNPRLRAESASVDRAEAGITTARAYLNPSITFGSLGRQTALMPSAAYAGMLHGLNVSQPFELPTVRSTRVRAAEVRRQATEFGLSEARLAVRGAVKQAFYDALRRRNEVELFRGTAELLEDLRRRIQVQVDVGEAARLELTRAEAEVATARIGARSAELRMLAAMSQLFAAVGSPLGQVELTGDVEKTQILPPLETMQEDMLAKHPSLALAEAETRYAEATLASEKAQRLPQPSVWMDWFQQPEAAQYRFGVTLTLPVLNRRQGQISEATATQRHATAVAQQQRVQLMAALERAYNMYQIATQQLQIFETGTLREAEAALAAAEAAFKFGERGILEVLDAQRVLRAARLDYLNARFDRQQALIELEQLRAIDPGSTTP